MDSHSQNSDSAENQEPLQTSNVVSSTEENGKISSFEEEPSENESGVQKMEATI